MDQRGSDAEKCVNGVVINGKKMDQGHGFTSGVSPEDKMHT